MEIMLPSESVINEVAGTGIQILKEHGSQFRDIDGTSKNTDNILIFVINRNCEDNRGFRCLRYLTEEN